MRSLRAFLFRLRGLFNRERTDRDLAEELETHLQMQIEDNSRAGMTPDEARREAMIASGGLEPAKEAYRDRRGLPRLENLLQDLRYVFRTLGKRPTFTLVAVSTLALGIGANTALFSVVDGLLLKPLPYPDSGRLITVWSKSPKGEQGNLSPADFVDYRDRNRVFDHLSGIAQAEFNVYVRNAAERFIGFRTTAGFFEALGVKPALGRAISPEDDRPGAPPVAILGYYAWQRRFGGDPHIVGKAVTVNGAKCTIIGVMPASFRFVFAPEMWMPFPLDPASGTREDRYLAVFGKLKPGVSLAQARAAMGGIARNLARAYPASLEGWTVDLIPWREWIIGPLSQHQDILLLFGAVGCVLLIACVNLANLLLSREASRARERAIRASVGASRGRLIAQVLTEGVLLALIGGAAGALLASWLAKVVATIASPVVVDSMAEVGINWRVLLFTLALSVLTGLLFSVIPAWRASKVDLIGALKEGGRGMAGACSGRRIRGALVVAEVALSLILLIGSGLMVRSLAALSAEDLGFRPQGVLTMHFTMPGARYGDAARIRQFDRLLLERVRTLPGVRRAGVATFLPMERLSIPVRFEIASHPLPANERPGQALQAVSDGYFEALGLSLRKGRFFTGRDTESAARVAIVDDAFARRYFPDVDPIGQRLLMQPPRLSGDQTSPLGRFDLDPEEAWEIVGVVAALKDEIPIYVPASQWTLPGGALAVRSSLEPADMAEAVRQVFLHLDTSVPVTDIKTMQEVAGVRLAGPRLHSWIVGSFAAVALILAALGIYGVLSYSVARRTHEMGVRLALGAESGDLVRMTLRTGLLITLVGLAIGLAGSLMVARLIAGMLYHVAPSDPQTYIVMTVLLFAVAMLAVYIPARRAASLDPLVALRWE